MEIEAVAKYFKSIPDKRQGKIEQLHRLITDLFPEVVVTMKYKMPTYETKQGWTALANQKRYYSLYTCGAKHLETFKLKNPGIKTGKGCINFKDSDELPLEDLKAVIRSAMTDRSH